MEVLEGVGHAFCFVFSRFGLRKLWCYVACVLLVFI